MNKKYLKIALVLIMILTLSGCVAHVGGDIENKAGFFTGIWQGWIAPFVLIYSIFDSNVTIYEINNTGFFYNLGFYMAIISGFGGLAFSRKKKR